MRQSKNCYPHCTLTELLVSYHHDMLPVHLSMGLFYKDSVRQQEAIMPGGVGNVGFGQCSALTAHNRRTELLGPLHSSPFFQDVILLDNVDMKIKLTSSKGSFC